ncbi:MAG: DUF4838 domain-containing protein [Elusimicrobiota bacterium]
MKNKKTAGLLLADDGRTFYSILLPQPHKCGSVEKFAAEELQKYFFKITGIKISIASTPKDGYRYISVGNTDIVEREHIKLFPRYGRKSFGGNFSGSGIFNLNEEWIFSDDGFIVKNCKQDVVLYGMNPRGTLYAVYSFLEQLGCRFYAPEFENYKGHAEYVPRINRLVTPVMYYISLPSLRWRKKDFDSMFTHDDTKCVKIIDWAAKNRINTIAVPLVPHFRKERGITWEKMRRKLLPEIQKRGLILEAGKHEMYTLCLSPEKYFRKHPEWYCLWEGKRIRNGVFSTANKNAVSEFIKNFVKLLNKYPEINVLQFWPPDVRRWSQAPEDQALGNETTRHALFVKTIAEVLRQKFPSVKLQFLAYHGYVVPPENIYFPDNTILDFCEISRSYQYRIYDKRDGNNRAYTKYLHGWMRRYRGDIGIYTYYSKYVWHSLPVILPKLIPEEIKYYSHHRIKGVSMYSEPDNWFNYEINHLLTAWCAWNTDADIDKYLTEYCGIRFGTAAKVLKNVVLELEKLVTRNASLRGTVVSDAAQYRKAIAETLLLQKMVKQCGELVTKNSTAKMFLHKFAGMLEHLLWDIRIVEAVRLKKDKRVVDILIAKQRVFYRKYKDAGILLYKYIDEEQRYQKLYLDGIKWRV